MADGDLGLSETAAMAIGGMVGGGIFAVLGVVAGTAGTSAWLSFLAAGIIALAAGYSLVRLNDSVDGVLTPVVHVERLTGSTKLAGMTGWTFVIGYVGTMSLYAYAFGGYFAELVGVQQVGGVPLRPLVTVAAVAVFVGLNLVGAHASGRTEDALVGLKLLILLVFGVGGLAYGYTHGQLQSGLSGLGGGPLVAGAIAFVAFEGWELLLFDQESIADPKRTVRRAIFASIVAATLLYVLVAVVTTNLVSADAIQQHSETALAIAAQPFLGQVGFALVSLAALFSTGSALNATLFSASRLSRNLVGNDLLPCVLRGDGDEPVRALLVLGLGAVLLGGLGSLDAISSFASLSFVTIFGGLSLLALRVRTSVVSTVVPLVGVLGSLATVAALVYQLATTQPDVLLTVAALAVGVVAVELLYFEREPLLAEVDALERTL